MNRRNFVQMFFGGAAVAGSAGLAVGQVEIDPDVLSFRELHVAENLGHIRELYRIMKIPYSQWPPGLRIM